MHTTQAQKLENIRLQWAENSYQQRPKADDTRDLCCWSFVAQLGYTQKLHMWHTLLQSLVTNCATNTWKETSSISPQLVA